MIKVKNLNKIYRTHEKNRNLFIDFFNRSFVEKHAVKDLSFEIDENELVGFIGPNGAGKTTTLKMLSGILFPTSGNIDILGYEPFKKDHSFLKQISFVMGHKNQLIWELSAMDSFILLKEIYEIEDSLYRKTLANLLDLLDCHKITDQPVKTLSLGQRMRMELIASLIHNPKVLFLDEPTIGLDIFAQTTIRTFIRNYQEVYKPTIILTSHYMQDVEQLARRIIMIDHGKLIYDGSLKNIIDKYSSQKIINITLKKPLPDKIVFPDTTITSLQFPLLKLATKKENIAGVLFYILKQIDCADITIENESIEDIVKKIFISSQNKVSRRK